MDAIKDNVGEAREGEPKGATWYEQSLYEQSWENYRNEDENLRVIVWQYLVFIAALLEAPCSPGSLALS